MKSKDLTNLDKLNVWISNNNQARLKYVQPRDVARDIRISEEEADNLLAHLVDIGKATRYFVFKCPGEYCQEEILIETEYVDDRIDCDLCGTIFVPKEQTNNFKDIVYEIEKEKEKEKEKSGGINYKQKYFGAGLSQKNRKVLDLDTAQFVDKGGSVIPFKGEKVKNEDESEKESYKIFISHNEEDKAIAAKLVKLLSDIGVERNSKNIFCSSYQGLGVPVGQTIPEYIRKEIKGNVIVLMLFSQNYYSSPASLCEMGAVWVNSKESIPIVIPPFKFEGIRGFVDNNSGVYLTNKKHLNEFRNTIRDKFKINKEDSESWEMDRDDFITNIEALTKEK